MLLRSNRHTKANEKRVGRSLSSRDNTFALQASEEQLQEVEHTVNPVNFSHMQLFENIVSFKKPIISYS